MLRLIFRGLGIDKAIGFTVISRLFQAFGGIVSVLLVSIFLTGIEQGFYYTFASILAVQIFFELGLGSIITQFVAHERIHLLEIENRLEGVEKNKSRLSHLFHFCLKWYAVLSIFIVISITIIGFVFFTSFYHSDEIVNWQLPWCLIVVGTTVNFVIAPISAFVEGLGKVKEIAQIRLLQQVFTQLVFWISLISGFKLFAAALSPFIGGVIFIIMGKSFFSKLLINIYKIPITDKISYFNEIFPYQWRIALSWISGYIIFQLFNPILFAYQGAIIAGQMGMTLNVLNAIMSLSDSWFATKVPKMSGLIATNNYKELDSIFYTTLRQSLIIVCLCVCILVFGIWVLSYFDLLVNGKSLSSRFLNPLIVAIMGSTIIMRQFQSGFATYLRCHKKEPLMWVSIFMSIACLSSTLIMAKYYGVNGIVITYAGLTFITTVIIYIIFKSKQKLWHSQF